MEQKGEVLGKAKKGHCKSRVGTNVGAGRLGAGWVGGKAGGRAGRLDAKGFIVDFKDHKRSLGGTELFAVKRV